MVDKCDSNPCLNGAAWTGLLNDFHCSCGSSHHGKVCKHEWVTERDYEGLEKFNSFLLAALNGWKSRGSCRYKSVIGKKTFNAAESSCVFIGRHLASIHSFDEEQLIRCQQSYSWIRTQLLDWRDRPKH